MHVKRIVIFCFYLVMVPTIMSWIPSADAEGNTTMDKGAFMSGQITTLLLLTISIFTALAAPQFQVCAHASMPRRRVGASAVCAPNTDQPSSCT